MTKFGDFIKGTGGSAAIGGVAGLLGMIGQKRREKRQMENQQKLMEVQLGHQQQLNQQQYDLQKQMWEETSYPAQIAMMKKAGLNPALMYGSAGSGGTTGSVGGGSASGGQASMSQGEPAQMGIEAIMAMKRIANESKLADAQAKLLEAQALNESEGVREKLQSEILKNIADANLSKMKLVTEEKQQKLMDSVKSLNEAQAQKAISETRLNEKDYEWMQNSGLNRNDSVVAKTIKYLAGVTGLPENQVVELIGGVIVAEKLAGILGKVKLK